VHVLDGRLPINRVLNDPVAGWQFLWARMNDPVDGRRTDLATVLRLEPRVAELLDLLPGWEARRYGPRSPWVRSERTVSDDETWL